MVPTPENILRERFKDARVYTCERDFQAVRKHLDDAIHEVYNRGHVEIPISNAAFLAVCQYLVTHGCKVVSRRGDNCRVCRI